MVLGITNGKDKFSRTTLHLLAESLVSVRLALSTLTRRTVADKLLSFIAQNVVFSSRQNRWCDLQGL
jgi:hypothetical protein